MTSREWARRSVHVGLGALAWVVPLVPWSLVAATAALATLANAFLLPRVSLGKWLLRPGADSGHRGLVTYPLAIAILSLLAREDHEFVQAGWIALAFGDGLAPIFALLASRPKWPWNARKSVGATVLAFGVAGLLAATVLSPREAACACGLAALMESLPRPVEDNLAVPMGAAGGLLLAKSLFG
jgi:dolichol kinase